MKRRLLLLLSLFFVSCVPMWIKTRQYAGDGTLRACSNILAQGFAIDFSPFDARKPYIASYRLSHVPQVGRNPFVRLCFHPKPGSQPWYPGIDDDLKKKLTATLKVTLLDARGTAVRSLEMPIATATWTWGESQGLIGAYDFAHGSFPFAPAQDYTLAVSYTPGSVPPATDSAYVQLEACAYY